MQKKRKQERHNRAHAAANDCINERLAEAAFAFHNGERFRWSGQNHLQRFDKGGEKSFLLPVIPRQTGARDCHPRSNSAASELRRLLADAGLDAELTLADGGDAIIAAARRAVEGGAQLVAAGGGDGTINAVASVVAGSGVRFGVLPLGTLNHFAKDLGIPLTLPEAVRNLATGRPVAVDVGEVNGRIFLNNSSLGLYPDIVHDREKQQRRLGRGKWLAACLTGLFIWQRRHGAAGAGA